MRTQAWMMLVVLVAFGALACGGDADDDGAAGAGASGSAGKDGASAGSSGKGGGGAAQSGAGSAGKAEAGSGGAGRSAAAVARGEYLVEHVAVCGDCHTPRNPDGSFATDKRLSGVDCFVDADPQNPDVGCLSSRNLTNDETGLKNRSDQEIKDMILKGERPSDSGGKPDALHPVMPYWVLGNMSGEDADALVAYLRTVPAVSHRVKARQAPFNLDAPAPRFPDAKIPAPRESYPERSAALRGRYLAGSMGVCLECHTPRDAMGAVIVDKAFQGGRAFGRAELGLPPGFPEQIYSSNITPDATGIAGWRVSDVVNALKLGFDEQHKPLCPPMPVGPMGGFGGLTDADAQDIAHYLLSLPPAQNAIPGECTPPGAGDLDAGVDAG